MSEKLQCTRRIRIDDGTDKQGRRMFHHEQCTASASEVEIKGMLTVAKAVLCAKHAAMADKDSFISERGRRQSNAGPSYWSATTT